MAHVLLAPFGEQLGERKANSCLPEASNWEIMAAFHYLHKQQEILKIHTIFPGMTQ